MYALLLYLKSEFYEENSIILKPWDKADNIFFIESGIIEVY